jgi:putative tricarboxylic transport membrane protein
MKRTLIGVDIAALVFSLLYIWGALEYSLGTLAQPGPGLFPMFIGVLLLISSIGSLLSHAWVPVEGELQLPKGKELGRVLAVIAGTVAYVVLLPLIGHILASTLTVFIVLHSMGLPSWGFKIAFAIAVSLGSFYLFDIILQVPLPRAF